MKPYRVLVTGSRDWDRPEVIHAALETELALAVAAGWQMIVIHGGAKGADAQAASWAHGKAVLVEPHHARWGLEGRFAGVNRNRRMVNLGADVTLAFIRNGSRGASHCARLAEEAGIPVNRYIDDTPWQPEPPGTMPRGL